MNDRTKKIILISVGVALIVGLSVAFVVKKRKGKKEVDSNENNVTINTNKNKNYIIGDSQTPFIDRNSTKASVIKEKGGEDALWKGGMGLKWLKGAVEKYPISTDVNSIIINIGTNGGFNTNDDINGLVSVVKQKFPNASLFVVKGSWGWGGNKNVTEEKVNIYYNKFKDLGVKIIEPAIGKVKDPHGNLPVYAKIGAEIDRKIS
jgi:hypothetical protein